LACLLRAYGARLGCPSAEFVTVLGMDAYHLTNDQLAARGLA
jgi:hypothetical protein